MIEIKSWMTGGVLFSLETETLKLCIEAAVKSGAYLCDANLRDANLRDANLCGANLCDANLCGAEGIDKFPIQIPGHKHFMQTTQDGNLRIGCEEYSFDEWREIADALGGGNGYSVLDVEIYKLHIEHIEKVSRLLWNKK
jgi:hypothetical protein